MALQLASESLGEREERDFQRRRENPPSPATERRLLLTAKRFHTVCIGYAHKPSINMWKTIGRNYDGPALLGVRFLLAALTVGSTLGLIARFKRHFIAVERVIGVSWF